MLKVQAGTAADSEAGMFLKTSGVKEDLPGGTGSALPGTAPVCGWEARLGSAGQAVAGGGCRPGRSLRDGPGRTGARPHSQEVR
jgi:hypothetical protein